MFYLTLILLIGVNISSFLMPNLYLWTAQQVFCQGVIGLMFVWMLFDNKKRAIKNLPLMLFSGWIVIHTTVVSYMTLSNIQRYNMVNFISYFNFLLIIVFYKSVQSLELKHIETIIKWLKYTLIATLLLTTLQILDIAQFFKLLDPPEVPGFQTFHNNLAVGFIGNGTHLSVLLASCLPVFLYFGKREDWLAIILTGLVMCYTGTTKGEPSISGPFIASIILGLWFFKNKKIFIPYVILLGIGGVIACKILPHAILSDNGRLSFLKHYWVIYKQLPVTGHGLGAINLFSSVTKDHYLHNLRHLHMEFFQFTFELGLVGGVLIIYLIKDFFSIKLNHPLGKLLKFLILGFLLSSCFTYPAHLWIPATWAMFIYASAYNLKNKELNHDL